MNNSFSPEEKKHSRFSDLKAGHVGIRTTKYEELLAWYQENLDFRVIGEWTNGNLKLAFISPPNSEDFVLEIIGHEDGELENRGALPLGFDHVSFHVNDVEKTVQELARRNIGITRRFDVPAIGLRVAFIADPFGNSIEFCETLK